MSEPTPIGLRSFDPGFSGPRYLSVRPDECWNVGAADVVIVGGGVAGIAAALEVAQWGSAVLVTKDRVEESNTRYAQGGVAAVLGEDDSIEAHVDDTLSVGGNLCREDTVTRGRILSDPEELDRKPV